MMDVEVILCGYRLFFVGDLTVPQIKQAIKCLDPKSKNLPSTRAELIKTLYARAEIAQKVVPEDRPLSLDEIEEMAQCDIVHIGEKVFTLRTIPAMCTAGICWLLNLDLCGDKADRFEKIYFATRGRKTGCYQFHDLKPKVSAKSNLYDDNLSRNGNEEHISQERGAYEAHSLEKKADDEKCQGRTFVSYTCTNSKCTVRTCPPKQRHCSKCFDPGHTKRTCSLSNA